MGACCMAPEASADLSIFPWQCRVSAPFAGRNLLLVAPKPLRGSAAVSPPAFTTPLKYIKK